MKEQELSLELDMLRIPKALQVSWPLATLIKWRSTGEMRMPYVRIGRQIKYRTKDLRAYIEKSTVR